MSSANNSNNSNESTEGLEWLNLPLSRVQVEVEESQFLKYNNSEEFDKLILQNYCQADSANSQVIEPQVSEAFQICYGNWVIVKHKPERYSMSNVSLHTQVPSLGGLSSTKGESNPSDNSSVTSEDNDMTDLDSNAGSLGPKSPINSGYMTPPHHQSSSPQSLRKSLPKCSPITSSLGSPHDSGILSQERPPLMPRATSRTLDSPIPGSNSPTANVLGRARRASSATTRDIQDLKGITDRTTGDMDSIHTFKAVEQFDECYWSELQTLPLHRSLSAFCPEFKWNDAEVKICQRRSTPPAPLRNEHKFVISFNSIDMENGKFEPLFMRVALYDLKKNIKLSEDVQLDFNEPQHLQCLDYVLQQKISQFQANSGNKALFTVNQPHAQIYLVIFVDRIFQGEMDDGMKPYLKPMNETEIGNFRNNAREKSKYLNCFRQPLLWGYYQVYKETTNGNIDLVEGMTSARQFFPVVGEGKKPFNVLSAISELSSEKAKVKPLNVALKMEVNAASLEQLPYIISGMEQQREELLSVAVKRHTARVERKKEMEPTFVGKFLNIKPVAVHTVEDALERSQKRKQSNASFDAQLQLLFNNVTDFDAAQGNQHFTFVNRMYIYPLFADFSSVGSGLSFGKNKLTAKNICIKITFRDNDMFDADDNSWETDDPSNTNGASAKNSVFVSRYKTLRTAEDLSTESVVLSSITYNCKFPQFVEEFKMNLPVHTEPSQHILFTFFNVGSSQKKKEIKQECSSFEASHKQLIGYSFLPVFNAEGNVLSDNEYCLPVYKNLKNNYTNPDVEKTLEKHASGKNIFTVRSKLDSTLHPQEENVHRFYKQAAALNTVLMKAIQQPQDLNLQYGVEAAFKGLTQSMVGLNKAKSDVLLTQFNVICSLLIKLSMLDILCKELCVDTTTCIAKSFSTLLSVMSSISFIIKDTSRRNPVLTSFVYYIFQNYQYSDNPKEPYYILGQLLCSNMKSFIQSYSSNPDDRVDENAMPIHAIDFSWVFFDIFVKSIVLYLQETGTKELDDPLFNAELLELSSVLSSEIIKLNTQRGSVYNIREHSVITADISNKFSMGDVSKITKQGNKQFALFIRDLFSILKTSTVYEMVYNYLEKMNENENITRATILLQLEFWTILTDDHYFVQLHFDCTNKVNNPEKSLIPLFIKCVCDALKDENQTVRIRGILCLHGLLTKIDFDTRYQKKNRREMIARAFFPFIETLVSNDECRRNISTEKFTELDTLTKCIFCFVFILQNINSQELREWWTKSINLEQATHFIGLLKMFMLVLTEDKNQKCRKFITTIIINHFETLLEDVKDKVQVELDLLFNDLNGVQAKLIAEQNADKKKKVVAIPTLPEAPVLKFVKSVCSFFMDILLTSYTHERNIVFFFFNRTLYNFLSNYNQTLKLAYRSELIAKFFKEFRTSWQWLFGAVLVHCELPVATQTHPAVSQCLDLLLQIYEDDSKAVDNANSQTDDSSIGEPASSFIVENGKIKGGTLDRLVERLATDSKNDEETSYNSIFLATYLSFTTPKELIQKLQERFQSFINSKVIVASIGNITRQWINQCYYDFDNYLVVAMFKFIGSEPYFLTDKNSATKIIKLLHMKTLSVKLDRKQLNISKFPAPKLPAPNLLDPPTTKLFSNSVPSLGLIEEYSSSYSSKVGQFANTPLDVMAWPAVELARQLTLIEFDIFQAVEPRELFKQAWTKPNRAEIAPNMTKLQDRFDEIHRWVQVCILDEADTRARKDIIAKFIEVMNELYKLNNFSSLHQIITALNATPITRLTKTWELLDSKLKDKVREYTMLMEPPFPILKETLQKASPPAIPSLGMYMKDLVYIEECSPAYLDQEKQLINFARRASYYGIVENIQLYQQKKYEFHVVSYLHYSLSTALVKRLTLWDDDRLFDTSETLQPKNRKMSRMSVKLDEPVNF